jgi:YegS/Rv2252/BmrU family lipid kinase
MAQIPMRSPIAVLVNAAAGAGAPEKICAGLAERFRSAGLDARLVLARNPAEFTAALERALGDAPQAIVAGGGDGTISSAASRLVGTGIALGVLPLGTRNHFARDLHIPDDAAQAVQNIVAGHLATVDVGEVNGRYFLNNASLGIYPEIVRDREHQQRHLGVRKWRAFLHGMLAVLRRYPFLDVRLTVDGQDLRRRTPFVFVGNNEYRMEGFGMGGRTRLNAGKLNIYLARRAGRLRLLQLALMALLARLHEAADVEVFTAAEILVDTRRRRVRVAIDGEVSDMDAPLRFRIRPGALRVIVPHP